jgi:hypothetical protein
MHAPTVYCRGIDQLLDVDVTSSNPDETVFSELPTETILFAQTKNKISFRGHIFEMMKLSEWISYLINL